MLLFTILFSLLFLTLYPSAWKHGGKGFYWVQLLRWVAGLLYSAWTFYVKLVDQTPEAMLANFAWIVAVSLLIDSLWLASGKWERRIGQLTSVAILLGVAYFLLIYPITIAQDQYEFVDAKVSKEKLEPMNEKHLPVVPREYAEYKIEKVLGKVKNYFFYDLGELAIQKIDNQLYWVAPIEYKGFFKWWQGDTVPGYIRVSAEDQRATAEVVKARMKYVPSAWLGENLYRRVRAQYPDVVLMNASFEPDEKGKPYYAVSYGSYEKYRRVRDVEGVILFDPSNGEMKKYARNKVPAFVDQVIPADVAIERNQWFGKYKHGFLNSLFGKRDVHIPTEWDEGEDEVIAAFDRSMRMHWVTDHTRDEEDAGSMVGYTMMDSRTGKITYYTGVDGLLNGSSAANVVSKTFKEKQWEAPAPILYNVYGENTWVLPVLDGNDVFRKVMLVNARDEKVYAYGDTKREALNKYQYAISTNLENDEATPTNQSEQKKEKGKVIAVYKDRISEENVVVQFLIEGNDKIFTVNSSKFPYAVFLEKGHKVAFSYLETKEKVVAVKTFQNESLDNKGKKKKDE